MYYSAFDTLKFAEKLISAGIPQHQARAIVQAQNEIFSGAISMNFANKEDFFKLERNLENNTQTVKELRKEFKPEINALKMDTFALKADMVMLKADVATLKEDVAILKTDVGILKTDVAVLKTDVAELKASMTRVALKEDVDALKTSFLELKSEFKSLKWMTSVTLTGVATCIVKSFF